MFAKWNLRRKIVSIAALSLVAVCGVLFTLSYREAKQNTRDEYISRARSIVLTAESIREEMARKWHLGLFSQEQLSGWAKEGELEKVLAAVPVVTAWNSAMAKASEGGYEFRVPKFHARNPKNEPDEIESRALKTLDSRPELTEYSEIDPERNAIRYFRPIKLTNECLLCHGDPARSQELWGNAQGLDPTGSRMENWKTGEIHGAFEVIQSLSGADAKLNATLRRQAAIVTGLIVLSGGLLFVLVTRSVTKPVQETVAAFQRFASGDLTRAIEVTTQDEVGDLRTAANGLMTTLRSMITRMDQCATELKSSSTTLQSSADQLASGAEQTTEQSTAVAAAAEEMSTNMQNMADSTDQMSANVRVVTSSVEQMTTAIAEVAQSAEEAASVADSAAQLAQTSYDRIGQLGRAADEIGKVIEVIQDIAEQTNLLALNATIEAARAGEAGKGFAVVATEVKQLAKQTAEATEDISARIEAIQKSSDEAIQAISEIGGVVSKVNGASRTIASAVEEQSITTKEIAQNVAQASASAQNVARGISETATAASEVTRNISQVDRNAKQTAADAGRTQVAGSRLISLADELQSLVQQFQTT